MATIAQDIGTLLGLLGWSNVTASTPDCVFAVQKPNGDVIIYQEIRSVFRDLLREHSLRLAATNAGVQQP